MKTFQDNAGHVWSVTLDVTAVRRVKGRLGLNLYGLLDDGFRGLAALVADPLSLCDVLYVLCEDEAQKRGVTDEDFGRGLRGEAITAAARAFHDEFADFYHDPLVRAGLRRTAEARGRLEATLTESAMVGLEAEMARLEGLDPASLASELRALSGASPAPSASTPAPSPSAS
jgi:hypothetical protein